MNLPPEIKSAEDFYWTELLSYSMAIPGSNFDLKSIDKLHQRDLAIWNAAIEKAAETAGDGFKLGLTSCNCAYAMKQAILNLKRKE